MSITRIDSSQIVTWTPAMTNPRLLGQIGPVNGLTHSYACPGGPDQLSCVLEIEADYRTDAMDPGRIVQEYRAGTVIWEGILQEPSFTDGTGWEISAAGAGNYGNNFRAVFSSTWPASEPDQSVNNAIALSPGGLRWVNPGVGTPSGAWFGQPIDSGSDTITDLLNLICTNGGLTWYVTTTQYGNILKVFALPTTPTRLLVCQTPVPRTLGGDVNAVYLRYQVTDDNATTGAAATFATTVATNAASILAHGRLETYQDLTSADVMTQSAAQAVGSKVLQQYVRASFGGPFVIQPGQLLTMGGQPVDIAMEQAGGVYQLMLTDFAYGGEVSPGPIQFLVGNVAYSDDDDTLTVTPFAYLATDFASLLGAAVNLLPQPATTSS
jgi:hypothetical protein